MMLGTHWQGSLGNPIAESTGPAGDIIKELSHRTSRCLVSPAI
ncbi:hypothetical protein C8D77_11629 [Mesorhizobium loti]|uniref:Uncharacterized protein n=1 Tax=Rhizobium loti TaxID=381 RepID=A0A8E3B2P6_RHILI|nr:hypothetical protein C8D77_11629 [Mesorhizobium loti]